jgi:dipeptidyl aminopeptidase/acylaminoacyl peptidase
MQFWIIEGHKGFRPGENPALYEHTASIRHLDKVRPDLPFLIVHGGRDRRAPFQQSVRLVEALKKRGNPVGLYSYPEEAHGFRLPKNRLHPYGKLPSSSIGTCAPRDRRSASGRAEPREECRHHD